MILYTDNKVSPVGKVNKADLLKIGRDTLIFFLAPTLMYVAQLSGTLSNNGVILLADLAPTLATIGAIQGWMIGVVINFTLKLQNGSK
jgi:hypothetical protein